MQQTSNWWESVDYGLTEQEQKQVKRLAHDVVERIKTLNLLAAAKKLGDIVQIPPLYPLQ